MTTPLRTLTVEETARTLHVTKRTIYTMLNRGLLKRIKVLRRTLIRESDLARFLDRGGRE